MTKPKQGTRQSIFYVDWGSAGGDILHWREWSPNPLHATLTVLWSDVLDIRRRYLTLMHSRRKTNHRDDLADLNARLRAFGRDCVHHGDMTPSGQRMLESILDEALENNQ